MLSFNNLPSVNDLWQMITTLQSSAMPKVDDVISLHRKNLEALNATVKIASDSIQAIRTKQQEIVATTISEGMGALKAFDAKATPQNQMVQQGELLQANYKRVVASLQEMGGLMQTASRSASDVLSKRFAEALVEISNFPTKAT